MPDLCLHVPPSTNLAGIGRFYEQVLGASTLSLNENEKDGGILVLQASPSQTLTFKHKAGAAPHAGERNLSFLFIRFFVLHSLVVLRSSFFVLHSSFFVLRSSYY